MHKRIINTDIDKYLSRLDLTQPVHTNPFMVFACMKWLADNSTNACEELATVPYSEDLVALVKKKADAARSSSDCGRKCKLFKPPKYDRKHLKIQNRSER